MKSQTDELIRELAVAEQFVRTRSFTEWAVALRTYQEFMQHEKFERLKYLWRVFAPTCAWDDLSATLPESNRHEATRIGESVFQAVEQQRIALGIDPSNWTYDD